MNKFTRARMGLAVWTRALTVVLVAVAVGPGCSEDNTTAPEPCTHCVTSMAPSHDVTIYEDPLGETSNSAGAGLFAGRTTVGKIYLHPPLVRRALIRFDLVDAGIPGGSVIDSVFLALTVTRTSALTGRVPFAVHRVLADWGEGFSRPLDEGGAGTSASDGDATWIHSFYPVKFWAEVGGDFDDSASASATADFLDEKVTWGPTAEMTADVQGWLDDPGTNFGWIVIGDESVAGTTKRFGSRENLMVHSRPSLKVFYTVPD
ncbi:MAG: DNRLRE domain-containing protein [bacterium]